jgi:hypothetical protein
MGEVFRAKDTKLNRDVAIKVLPAEFASDRQRVARFKREAQVLASLNHPKIAGIHGREESGPDAGSGDGSLTIVALIMELVEGEDLSTLMARGPISIAEALPIARQIAEALEAAHEQGIVHRDLKPGNIKVRADGTVKVLDFGLARATDPTATSNPNISRSPTLTHQGTQTGVILGTAAYMSPEQAMGKPVDKRADIWSFGVALHEMLTGTRLFKGDGVNDTLAAVLKQEVDLNALPSEAPPRLARLIGRCLDRDLRTRLRDIGEARIEISKIESGGVGHVAGARNPCHHRSSRVHDVAGAAVGARRNRRCAGCAGVAPFARNAAARTSHGHHHTGHHGARVVCLIPRRQEGRVRRVRRWTAAALAAIAGRDGGATAGGNRRRTIPVLVPRQPLDWVFRGQQAEANRHRRRIPANPRRGWYWEGRGLE